jgi:hypothetical protein
LKFGTAFKFSLKWSAIQAVAMKKHKDVLAMRFAYDGLAGPTTRPR